MQEKDAQVLLRMDASLIKNFPVETGFKTHPASVS